MTPDMRAPLDRFDPVSLLLVDDEAARLLAAWPLVIGRKAKPKEAAISGWTYDRDQWLSIAQVGPPALRRHIAVFDRAGFIDGEDGSVVPPVQAFLRRRVADRMKPSTKRKT